MSAIDLARARARAQAANGSFSAGISPDQLSSGSPNPDMIPPGLLGNWVKENKLPEREQYQVGGSLAGTILSGMNPAGGAAGFALADQLYDKYKEGKEITPSGAATSLGEGALYEYAPKVALKGLSKLIPEDLARSLMTRALRQPEGVKQSVTDKIAQYALDNKLAISKKQIEKSADIFRENAKIVDDRVKELAAQGVEVDPLEVVAGMRKSLRKPFEGVSLSGPDRLKADKMADELLMEFRDTYGMQPGTSYPNKMPITDALANKRADDAFAAREHLNAAKTMSPVPNASRVNARKAAADGYREILNRDKTIADANRVSHERLQWLEAAARRARKQGTSSLIPSEVIMPVTLESFTKGGPGLASALGVGRAVSSHPYALSQAGLLANEFKNNSGKYIPRIYNDLFYKNLFNDYEKGKKGEEKKKKSKKK